MIAVTFALPSESSDFRRLLGDREREIAILHTGVGAEICQRRIEPFLDRQRFDFVISSGFAGGVDPSLGVGDLVLADNFSDPELLDRARAQLHCRVATLATAARVIASEWERIQLARENGAAALDMETKWIARACAERQIPMLSLRVISDTTVAPFPAPPEVLFDLARQRTNTARLAAYLARHPSAIFRLIRFSRQIALARARLTNAVFALT